MVIESGQKKRSPVVVPLSCAVQDGASFRFDLAHVIKIEGFRGLDDQLPELVFFDVEGVSLVVVGEQLVSWMLRYVILITEKRSHTSELQDTFAAVHDCDLVLRHQFFATMSSDEFKNRQKNNSP